MKITFPDNKLVPFGEIVDGTVFKDPATENSYYIKTVLVVDEDTGADKWNCLCLDNYTLDCFAQKYLVYPIDNAELIIP